MTTIENLHLTAIDQHALADVCVRYGIRRLALFGSVLRDDFRPDSDIDVLTEFGPDAQIGWEFVALGDELSAILGRAVDLNTPDMLSRYFRRQVLDEMQVVYEEAG